MRMRWIHVDDSGDHDRGLITQTQFERMLLPNRKLFLWTMAERDTVYSCWEGQVMVHPSLCELMGLA